MLQSNTVPEQRLILKEQTAAKSHINNPITKRYVEGFASESDVSLGEHDLTKQQLYPLPGGSFILSEKPPIIITPRHASPINYCSVPVFSNDDQEDGDYTPKNHHSYVPLSGYTRRLTAAASTSNLLLTSRRRAKLTASHLHRSYDNIGKKTTWQKSEN